MQGFQRICLWWVFVVWCPLWLSSVSTQPLPASIEVQCTLTPQSTIVIKGRSNVSSFECHSRAHAISREVAMNIEAGGAQISFNDARLVVVTSQLDCGLEAMNNDLQEALKADRYPLIYVELVRALNESCQQLISGAPPHAYLLEVKAHIAGVTRTLYPKVTAEMPRPGWLHLKGKITLHLPDFDIEPPSALWGMVKVAPDIEVHYHLYVTYEFQ